MSNKFETPTPKELHRNAKEAGVDTSHSRQTVMDEHRAYADRLKQTVLPLPSTNGKAETNGHSETDDLVLMNERMTAPAPIHNGRWNHAMYASAVTKYAPERIRAETEKVLAGLSKKDEAVGRETEIRRLRQNGGLEGALTAGQKESSTETWEADTTELEALYADEITTGNAQRASSDAQRAWENADKNDQIVEAAQDHFDQQDEKAETGKYERKIG